MYDRDNTGSITCRTLKFLLRGLGDNVNQEEVQEVLKAMDEDGNGTIDFREFLLYMLQKINTQSLTQDIIEIFSIFDRNSTGYITPIELRLITQDHLPRKIVDQFIEIADVEGEGQINYKQFVQTFLK